MLYGVIATFQSFPSFGRVYAAYGGVFIIMSLIFAMVVDKQMPDKYDVIGAIICIVGVLVMLLPAELEHLWLEGEVKMIVEVEHQRQGVDLIKIDNDETKIILRIMEQE